MAKRSGPKKADKPKGLLERMRALLERELDAYEAQLEAGKPTDKRTLVMLAAEVRKYDAYERKGRVEFTTDGVVEWASTLSPAERAELVRRLSAIDGPRGSGLA